MCFSRSSHLSLTVMPPPLILTDLGGAYGTVFTGLFPDLSTGIGAYTILGMGALAAAVLGAPISTALVIFEMTNDYALTLALMIVVVISSMITRSEAAVELFVKSSDGR